MFKRKNNQEKVKKSKKKRVTIKEKINLYRADQQEKFDKQKSYFASDDDRSEEQYIRDQQFAKDIVKMGVIFAIFIFVYVLLIRRNT